MITRTAKKAQVAAVPSRSTTPAQREKAAAARARFAKDELSTGRASAHRKAAGRLVGTSANGATVSEPLAAFDRKLAEVERAVAAGVPGAREELAAVLRDREGVRSAIADVERELAACRDPKARPALEQKLAELRAFGLKVAAMNPTERQNLQNFFRLAKEDPEGLKRFVAGVQAQQANAAGAAAVQPAATGASPGIQAAIDFGRSQVGAPYVGGASPFRFGTPGDGRTYQMSGQRAYVSPRGVVGYDCSGLMVTMLKKAGIDLSRLSSSRAMKAHLPQVPKSQLQPGDLLVKNGHVAMYLGNGQMIEAVPSGVRVGPASKYLNDPAYTGHRPG